MSDTTDGTPVTTGAPAAATTQATGLPGQGGASAASPQADTWISSLPPGVKEWAANKRFSDVGAAMQSYHNLEKFVGVPQEQIFRIPQEGDQTAYREAMRKLGLPEKPEQYELKGGSDPTWMSEVAQIMHKHGVAKTAAQGLVADVNAAAQKRMAAQAEVRTQKMADAEHTLRREWGQAYEQNLAVAKSALAKTGITEEQAMKVQDALGPDLFVRAFHKLGASFSEDSFVGARSAASAVTPGAASVQIAALKGDQGFLKRLMTGDRQAVAEWTRLHEALAAGR